MIGSEKPGGCMQENPVVTAVCVVTLSQLDHYSIRKFGIRRRAHRFAGAQNYAASVERRKLRIPLTGVVNSANVARLFDAQVTEESRLSQAGVSSSLSSQAFEVGVFTFAEL